MNKKKQIAWVCKSRKNDLLPNYQTTGIVLILNKVPRNSKLRLKSISLIYPQLSQCPLSRR